MPTPRKSQISIEATPYYHCVSRCVRHAFLCGQDRFTGRSFDHRRAFIESEILRLGKVFFVDVVGYAVMANHFHVVLFIDQSAQTSSSKHDVICRWHRIHKGNSVSTRYLNDEHLEAHEIQQLEVFVELWRNRLASISWFMRVINESVARMANTEDNVTGRFWEGRFKCQALLDEQALLSCLAYVDLDPVRAGIARTPEHSDHTSIKLRIQHCQSMLNEKIHSNIIGKHVEASTQTQTLHPFIGDNRQSQGNGINFNLIDYLQLVDWTGRQIRENKKGYIENKHQPILERLSIPPGQWIYLCTHFESHFKRLVGTFHSIKNKYHQFGRKRGGNLSVCNTPFN